MARQEDVDRRGAIAGALGDAVRIALLEYGGLAHGAAFVRHLQGTSWTILVVATETGPSDVISISESGGEFEGGGGSFGGGGVTVRW